MVGLALGGEAETLSGISRRLRHHRRRRARHKRRARRWSRENSRIIISCRRAIRVRERAAAQPRQRSEEHTSELQSLMPNSYAVFCLIKKKNNTNQHSRQNSTK